MLEVLVTQIGCAKGQCPKTVHISPTVGAYVVEAPIYRPNPLAGLLSKNRAVPVIVLTVPEEKKTKAKK